MILKIAIIDDNPKDLDLISKVILDYCQSKSFQIELFKSTDPYKINFNTTNLTALFLDIEMPEINGIDLAREITDQNPVMKIIFVTNMDHLVYDASRIAPFGFVRKSKLQPEIVDALNRLFKIVNKHNKSLLIQNPEGIYKVKLDSILWASIYRNIIEIHTTNGTIQTRSTLKSFLLQLPECFLKINKSFIINMNYVDELHLTTVVMVDKQEIPINSRAYKPIREEITKYIQRNLL